MFVLGVDPGLSRCGYGLLERGGGGRHRAVAAGVIVTDPSWALPARLQVVHEELRALVREFEPDVMAVERVFFQVNARTAMSVGQVSGLALVAASDGGCEVVQYTSNEVKQAVVGYGSATKRQVQRMVASSLSLQALPHPPDAADALALALCHLATVPLRRALAATSARGTARDGTARDGTARDGTARDGTARNGTARNGNMQKGRGPGR